MNSVVIDTEQKKKEIGGFIVTVQMLLSDGHRKGTYKVPAYIAEDLVEKLTKSDKKDAVLEYAVKSGNKEGKSILIGMGRKILILKSNGEDYSYTAIPRENCMLEMPEKNIYLNDLRILNQEYSLKEFFRDTNKAAVPGVLSIAFSQALRPLVICKDGLSLSIQASNGHYCAPSENNRTDYVAVEIGNVSEEIPEIKPYEEMGSEDAELSRKVYGFVPREIVEEVLRKHGGIDKEKTLSESYLTKMRRVEQSLNSANSSMDDMQALSSLVERITGIKDIFGR